ncbi:MAG: UDP-glucose 4-epimerase GalE [Clostridiales bacterium]|nr:UDP-glucose 4-epimerase GalE [Clostridiales bacterium]
MKVLVTGGAGYIGSTTASALEDAGHTPIILDSLIRGRREYAVRYPFYEGDIADRELLGRIFREHPDIGATLHFAALIVVPESVAHPYLYYHENVVKSLELFRALDELGCERIIFSSSASIYGSNTGSDFKVSEDTPHAPDSPYARTKHMIEMALEDMSRALHFRSIALRYFNPIGADPAMRTGPYDEAPTHVLDILADVASGRIPIFRITGVDWPTRDGSGIRDYLHVWDLARAHVLAVERFDAAFDAFGGDFIPINLGSGRGVTVRELVAAFETVWGKPIAKEEAPPRDGDVAGAYASADRAAKLLGWKTELPLTQTIADALRWVHEVRPRMLGY